MIWLGSFPRSGNTFFRNILVEVYHLESSSFFENIGKPENYTDYPFVKTHMRPHELLPISEKIQSVYLIRDGRDALVSMAHQRKDIYDPTSNFRDNFIEALIAAEESYFGGWSVHVQEWVNKANIVIRFEDLIEQPIEQVDRINSIYNLPEKDINSLPTFEQLKFGKPKYGRGKRIANSIEEEEDIIRKSFRKGKAYGWKDELDRPLQNLFWSYHRTAMESMGYDINGGINMLNPDFDYLLMKGLGQELPKINKPYHILIEANKLLMHQNDGVKRYLLELLKALIPVSNNPDGKWKIDLYLKGRVYPLKEYASTLLDVNKSENSYNKYAKVFKLLKKAIKIVVPKRYQETFSKYSKKVLMKIGLKFAKNVASLYYVIERLKSGKEIAKENYESQIAGVEIGKYDLIHVPLPQHYEPFLENTTNFLVTIHDLTHKLFPDYHTSNNIEVAEKGFAFFKSKNADYISISNSTKNDILKHTKISDEHIYTVYEAADNQKFKPNLNTNKGLYVRSRYGIPDEPFLFTLSTLEPRKNLLNTIKAFDLLLDEFPNEKINLVIGGKNGWKSKDLMKMRHHSNIIFTGFIDENDLPLLYNEAEGLCYISHYEGFGLPILEAMSCKTPVIYGDNSSMKEFFEGYGLPAQPNDLLSIKEQMKVLIIDSQKKKELAEKSLERSFDFSWRKTAIDTIKVYEEVILKNKKG